MSDTPPDRLAANPKSPYYDPKSTRESPRWVNVDVKLVEKTRLVTLDEMRDFLLSLPGLPSETVQQLRLIRNWSETLPIPIPTDRINWQHATFKNRHQGLLLNDNTGIGSAAIWQADGHLYGLAGSLRATELKRVADSLAVR